MSETADRRFEILLGYLLRAGVLVAAAVVAVGAVVYVSRYGGTHVAYRAFAGEPEQLRSIAGIVGAARASSGRGLIQLGLLLLIATPIARVVSSIVGFALERDWLYVTVTTIVLVLLLFSLTWDR